MSIQVVTFYLDVVLEMRQNLQLQPSPDSSNPLWVIAFLAYTAHSLQITK
jgi:hypothetical protein